MSHLLIVELPGGNDTDILTAALEHGHRFTFLTADPGYYQTQSKVADVLARAEAVIAVPDFAVTTVIAAHQADPFDAILCLQDLRTVEAAQLAAALGLRFLNPATATLARDKAAVRARLAEAGILQPPTRLVDGPDALLAAVAALGLPLIVKPVDGFGSQNIFALRTEADLAALQRMPDLIAAGPGVYGLGVVARGAMLVERLLDGVVIGCDTMSAGGRHVLLGVNEKLFFPRPSFAIRGGCFTSHCGQFGEVEAIVCRLLDAIGFDYGAAHIELMLTEDGPQLIEINPRLVGALIPRLVSAALGRSVHADLIDLHLTGRLPALASAPMHAVTRWFAAGKAGTLVSISLPPDNAPLYAGTDVVARPGDTVGPPYDNADRLGCVRTCGPDRAEAEALAERLIAETFIEIA